MDNSQLIERVRQKLEEGVSKEAIYSKLLEHGYKVETIQKVLKEAERRDQESLDFEEKSQSDKQGEKEDEDSGFTFLKVVSVVGALLVGVGVISLVAANWQSMGDSTKVILILVGMLGSYTVGGYLRFLQEMVYTGNAVLLLGNIIFGAGVFLIGQIYNLQIDWPTGFMLWAFGSLVLGMVTRMYPILYMTLLLLVPSTIGGLTLLFGGGSDSYLFTSKVLPVLLLIAVLGSIWWLREELPSEEKQTF